MNIHPHSHIRKTSARDLRAALSAPVPVEGQRPFRRLTRRLAKLRKSLTGLHENEQTSAKRKKAEIEGRIRDLSEAYFSRNPGASVPV